MKDATRETALPSPIRRDTVVMGRTDYASIVLRLIGVELYKIRRRSMSKILSIIGIFVMFIVFFAQALNPIMVAGEDIGELLPPPCTAASRPGDSCLDHKPTAVELQHAEKTRQEMVRQNSTSLRLPDSLYMANTITQGIGLLLVAILAGTIVGGEYSVGTLRLMLTRGPTRTQFILSKVGAILACIIIGVCTLLLSGVVFGAILNLFTGIAASFTFFSGTWLLHMLLYVFVSVFGLFTYAMVALCLATFGRATTAGVAGALVWWVLESVLSLPLNTVGTVVGGVVGEILKAIPGYFIGNNINTLLQNQIAYMVGGSPSPISDDAHAFVVLLLYQALSIGLALWITRRRDVTN